METFFTLLAVAAMIAYLVKRYSGGRREFVCERCHHVGTAKSTVAGNGAIELLLWLTFIIPGVIYSFWRLSNRYSICKKCGAKDLIPVDTPRGNDIVNAIERKRAREQISQRHAVDVLIR